MVRQLHTAEKVKIKKGVEVTVKNREVTIKGPRGTLKKNFNHLPVQLLLSKDKRTLTVEVWFGNKKMSSGLRTICTHISNMQTGVLQGFRYKMRFVAAHFPINANIVDGGKEIEVRNFLGEKLVRKVPAREGVTITRSTALKDEIILEGNDVEKVSQTCADIHHSVLVKNKDIRKFLDGIYVSEKGAIQDD